MDEHGCALGKDKGGTCAAGPACKSCGWYGPEERRRKALPLVQGQDGLWRKVIGEGKAGDNG